MALASQPGPGSLLDFITGGHTKKTQLLVGDPQISRTILGDGMHDSAGNAAYGNIPVIRQVADPAKRGDPDSSATVLKKGLQLVSWQSIAIDLAHPGHRACAALTVNRNLPVIP